MADASDDLGIPMKAARPPVPGPGAPVKPPTMPPRAPDLQRAGDAIRAPEPPRRPGDPVAPPRREAEVRKLTVGREITLSGEITSCDKLIIEGSVEANLNNVAMSKSPRAACSKAPPRSRMPRFAVASKAISS